MNKPACPPEFLRNHPLLTALGTLATAAALAVSTHTITERLGTDSATENDRTANDTFPLGEAEKHLVFGAIGPAVDVFHSPSSTEPCATTEAPIDLPDKTIWTVSQNGVSYIGIKQEDMPATTIEACQTDADGIYWVYAHDDRGQDQIINAF